MTRSWSVTAVTHSDLPGLPGHAGPPGPPPGLRLPGLAAVKIRETRATPVRVRRSPRFLPKDCPR